MHKLKNLLNKEIFLYILAVLLCCFFLFWVLQLWSADFKIPFDYHWDTLNTGASIKGMIDNGWYTINHFIGAPYGYQYYDFASDGNLDIAIMKLISLVFPNWAMTLNIYFLLTFPLAAIAALFVLRKLGISRITSLVGSLLFTFLPFHFLQGEPHITLAAYYLIPLVVLVCLWLFEEDFTLKIMTRKQDTITNKSVSSNEQSTNEDRSSINWRGIGAILICLGIGSAFIYYPFFACFFLLVAGAGAAIARKKWQPLFNCGILIGVIVLLVLVYSLPTLFYQYHNGANLLLSRDPAETEVWGLKIVELIFPILGNSNPFLAALADKYQLTAPFVNENSSAALGIIGSIGFIVLIVTLFVRAFREKSEIRNPKSATNTNSKNAKDQNTIPGRASSKPLKKSFWNPDFIGMKNLRVGSGLKQLYYVKDIFEKIGRLSILNAAAVLLGTVGGLGTITAYLVFPAIRTYTRISIFIAFFSLLAVAWLIDYIIKKTSFSQTVVVSLLVAVLVVGIRDQTSPQFVPDYQSIKQDYMNDDRFVKNIEATYPADNLVFQLPYNAYPESLPPYNMTFYDPFRGYLHSTTIRWSYGTMKGRYGDFWESGIAGKTTDEMLKALSFSGFNGIYVDSYGYADNGKEIIASLSSILSVTPLKSDNGRLYFFDMTAYNAGLKPQYTAAEYAEQKTEALYPLYYEFRDGFSPLPSDASIQLCKAKGALVLTNFTAEPKKITLNATFETGFPEISDLKLVSSLFSDDLKINGDGYDYVKEIVVPPGKYVITLSCDAAPSYIPGKYMSTVFAVVNFKVVDHD